MTGMRTSANSQRGAVIAEMVLVTPILLFIMLATAEVTRAFIDHNTLTKAVRNGVRYLAANANDGTTGIVAIDATLQSQTQNLVVYGNTTGTGSPVIPGLTAADITVVNAGGNNVRVSATHTISGLLGPVLNGFFWGSDISLLHDLDASVTMRAL